MAALALACAVATAAHAQDAVDPYATAERQAKSNDIDTDLTPVAKASDLWTLVHGAKFGEPAVVDGSVTTFDTDLFAVSFRNPTIGLAGGSACPIEPQREPGESDADFGRRVADCRGPGGESNARIPALYRYAEPLNADPSWDRLELPGPARSGYIGAIAWIDSHRALIVGGSGSYPRREAAPDGFPVTHPAKTDQAGRAHAWVYKRATDSVREIDLSAFTSNEASRAGMRGFTAAACYTDPDPKPGEEERELCFAGALGQLWEWADGDFTGARVDSISSDDELADAALFRYRVRDIAFAELEPPVAVAVTAGCCAEDQTENEPSVLVYDGNLSNSGMWSVRNLSGSGRCSPVISSAIPGACLGDISPDMEAEAAKRTDRPELPDSLYSLTIAKSASPNGDSFGFSTVVSPGGPVAPREPASVITPRNNQSRASNESLLPTLGETRGRGLSPLRSSLSTTRLVDGDGDFGATDSNRPSGAGGGGTGADGEPDWAVGEVRSTRREGLGARGVIVATTLPPTAMDAVNEGRGVFAPPAEQEVIEGGYEPLDPEKLDAYRRSRQFLLPSYSANAIDVVGAEEDGWVVGDHGAIQRLSSSAVEERAGTVEPTPPQVGSRRPRSLSDRGAWEDDHKQLPDAGSVPALGAETISLREPRMVPSGAPSREGSIDEIVMSRDGSDGWAIGSDGGGATFHHFDGVSWTTCDPVGVPGRLAPDPACAALAPLRGWWDESGRFRTTDVVDAARIPLETDSNPSNDDELEIVAILGDFGGPESGGVKPALISYRDGRWRFEPPDPGQEKLRAAVEIAFTGPDDGWVRSEPSTGFPQRLYHFDGDRWFDCRQEPLPCGDPEGRLPAPGQSARPISGLAVSGERVYAYGGRLPGEDCVFTCTTQAPMIIYHDRGRIWTDGGGDDEAGFDPAFTDPGTTEAGRVESISVVHGRNGYEGWAVGRFTSAFDVANAGARQYARIPPGAVLMRLEPGSGWELFKNPGALEDYMRAPLAGREPALSNARLQVTYATGSAPETAFIGQEWDTLARGRGSRIFGFETARGRFEMLNSGRPQGTSNLNVGPAHPAGVLRAMAPDGRGGFWAAVSGHMFHYTAQPSKPIFGEVADPLGIRGATLRALAGGPDGSVWAATGGDRLFRFDRHLGWESVRVGWDAGQIVTRSSRAEAIAVGPGGNGLVVGEGGRIAELSPTFVRLDPATGRSCALGDAPPCGTSRTLRAVDIAPDGSALVAGDHLSLLWRPAGGSFQSITKPRIASSTTIEAVSYPSPGIAYLATDRGKLFRGELIGGDSGAWSWQTDNVDDAGELISRDAQGELVPIRDIDINSSGHGYAVGDGGLVLRRSETGDWEWLATRSSDDLTTVALPETGGEGALVGGRNGLVMTISGSEVGIARPGDFGSTSGDVVGVTYLPGSKHGSVEAWVGVSSARDPAGDAESRIFRYRSDPGDPMLGVPADLAPLPDVPVNRSGDLVLGAFGKSDCDLAESELCPEMTGTTTTNELVSHRTADELARLHRADKLDLAVITGDVTDSAGLAGSSLADIEQIGSAGDLRSETQSAGQLKHRRYRELVVEELGEEGVPLFGSIGGQDLSENYGCGTDGCYTTKNLGALGENLAWREAFAGRMEPWGSGEDELHDQAAGEYEFIPVRGSDDGSVRIEDQRADADGEGAAPETKAEIGGANTHYAVEAIRDGERVARIVFVDTSMRSLQASDPLQQPQEPTGGQTRFLERMICKEGGTTSTGDECTRAKDQAAIVVSNTPTYSYGPGALTHTATDANVFEALVLKHDVDLVISGALGYNGLYYTLAPGIHEPCPGGEHPQGPPKGGLPSCAGGTDSVTKPLEEHGVPNPQKLLEEQGLSGAVPTLIASGAGGKFGPDGNLQADGPAGQWHGYSIARLQPDGEVIVEQRPILDWIGMDAADHTLHARSRLELHGYGRSPISTTTEGQIPRAFHYEISNAAITHRYDLVLADPDQPWLPCDADDADCRALHAKLSVAPGQPVPTSQLASAEEPANASAAKSDSASQPDNPCAPYLCLPKRIGTVDRLSGEVKAKDGKHPETFAIAMLSVDDKVATYPLVFKPSPSFVVTPFEGPPQVPANAQPAAPPPPSLPKPQIPSLSLPTPPTLPAIPPLVAATPPEPAPPAPPAPPPPSEQPSPLNLSVAPTGLTVATPTAVIQPPTPPVNPAPPGGARREARQRQAAAQKSGADNAEEGQDQNVDMADSPSNPTGAAMTRHEAARIARQRPAPSFTPIARTDQPSAWSRGVLYGGGITLMAFALAAGWSRGRPTPRRREPRLPAPAWAESRRRR